MSFVYSGSLWSCALLWRFLAVCGFVQVACQGFLVREACASYVNKTSLKFPCKHIHSKQPPQLVMKVNHGKALGRGRIFISKLKSPLDIKVWREKNIF